MCSFSLFLEERRGGRLEKITLVIIANQVYEKEVLTVPVPPPPLALKFETQKFPCSADSNPLPPCGGFYSSNRSPFIILLPTVASASNHPPSSHATLILLLILLAAAGRGGPRRVPALSGILNPRWT